MRLRAVAAVVVVFAGATLAGQGVPHVQRPFVPVDEGAKNPGFFAFRAALQAAIARRDVEGLMSRVHSDVRAGFGEQDGIAAFRETYHPERAESSMWAELAEVLALGGKFIAPHTFEAPYVSAAWPPDVDGFEHVAVVAEAVRVRAAPGPLARQIGTVGFEILPLGETALARGIRQDDEWTSVRFGGREAFIATRYLRVASGFRAVFAFEQGRWQMIAFVAGD